MKLTIEEYLNQIGEPGSESRLKAIARLNLGERSEAAERVLTRRYFRKELMAEGLSFEMANMIQLLEEIDELLAYLEDFTHGEDGEAITKLRGRIAKWTEESGMY